MRLTPVSNDLSACGGRVLTPNSSVCLESILNCEQKEVNCRYRSRARAVGCYSAMGGNRCALYERADHDLEVGVETHDVFDFDT